MEKEILPGKNSAEVSICQGAPHDQGNLEALNKEIGDIALTPEGGYIREQIVKEPYALTGNVESLGERYGQLIKDLGIEGYLATQRLPEEIRIAVARNDINKGDYVSLPNDMKNLVISPETLKAIIDKHIENKKAQTTRTQELADTLGKLKTFFGKK